MDPQLAPAFAPEFGPVFAPEFGPAEPRAAPGAGTPAVAGCCGDAGAVTVEAALGICSLAVVCALVLGGVGALVGQIRCTDAAVEAARLVSRGEPDHAPEAVARSAPAGAELSVEVLGDRISTSVTAPPFGRLLPGNWLHGRAFAFREPIAPNGGGP